MSQRIDALAARRIALAAQGFHRPRPAGRIDVRHHRRLMSTIGLLQLDSVNVLARSHYLPVFARLGAYDRAALDRFTSHSRELFEYWGHEASLLPVETFPLFRWKMEAFAARPWRRPRELMESHPGYIETVEQEISDRGPLTVSDLEDGGTRSGSWWGHGRGKTALEWLFATGRVTAYRRAAQFVRVYDLTERLIPAATYHSPPVERRQAHRELILRSARSHGIGTTADLADYYRLRVPAVRPILDELVGDGLLISAEVPGWRGPVYLHPDAVVPRSDRGTGLLSPFDPVVWNRDRAQRIFGFHYRIEIYVPEPRRTFGYYVLPFLLDGDLVARVDLKAHRAEGVLEVRGAFGELDVSPASIAGPLRDELALMAQWLGLETVAHGERGNLMPTLRRA